MKNRYLYNAYNDNQTITVRPGITWFWLDGLEPFLNINLQYELYFPLNYGVSTIYEQWLYLNVLYHMNSNFKAGIFGALKKVTWGASEEFKELFPDEEYAVTYLSYVIGVSAIFYFSL